MSDKKRVRNPNWDNEEKTLLMEILERSINVINDKKTDTNANKKKKLEWELVLNRFNELNKRKRDLPQLQAQWKQIKIGAKTACYNYSKSLSKTGGGPPPPQPKPEDVKVMEMIPLDFEVDVWWCNMSTHTQISDSCNEPIMVIEVEEALQHNEKLSQDQSTLQEHELEPETKLNETPNKTPKLNNCKENQCPKINARRKLVKREVSGEDYKSSILKVTHEAHNFRNELLMKEHEKRMAHMDTMMNMYHEQHDLHMAILKKIYDKM